jgi:protein TonB
MAGLLAGTIEIGLVLALLFGLAGVSTMRNTQALVSIAFPATQPSPRPPPQQQHKAARRSSPANKPAKAATVYAPPIPRPAPPIPASPHAGIAEGADNGAALRPGPGGGAGGVGNGTGAGGNGQGDGGEDAEWTGGKIRDSDFPSEARKAKANGTTETEIAVTPEGRPAGCRVTRSSGNGLLDATTCRLVMARFRFRPARDGSGWAIAGMVEYDQEWTLAGQD